MKYATERNLGGLMIWALDLDDDADTLLNLVSSADLCSEGSGDKVTYTCVPIDEVRWWTPENSDEKKQGQCGKSAPLINGFYPVCDPDDPGFSCCGAAGYCGSGKEYCDCKGCVNYRQDPNLILKDPVKPTRPIQWYTQDAPDGKRGRCGKDVPMINGEIAICNPDDDTKHCCSNGGYCGVGKEYCSCEGSNQALADALHSTTFLLYFCPMVLLDQPLMKEFSHYCGFILLFCYELSVKIHLAISINRFCAVWAPYKYKHIFSDRNTKIYIFGIWVFTGSVAVLFYEKFCHFFYDDQIHFLTFTNNSFCGYIGWYGDFLKNAAIVAAVVSIDIFTILKVRQMSKKVVSNISNQSQNNLSHREVRFLKQTVTQGAVFMLELLTYFFVPLYFENKWIVFFGTSFAWVAVHAVDGMVVVLLNSEVRSFLIGQRSKSHGPSTNRATAN
ncbi:hypothetical protein L3Y34_006242 [Caenorhabditis briggsae]|uniref:Uncharacterized protein n=2 Tax=Caenorhabditis briggsae TaxID=6238 RepID=A0AAE8ZZ75_CAEBR|nr:hypothetical protein L3Y34_006242 [Caenorhabditis briggsae]